MGKQVGVLAVTMQTVDRIRGCKGDSSLGWRWFWKTMMLGYGEGRGELPGLTRAQQVLMESQALWGVGAVRGRAGVAGGAGRGEKQPYDLIQRLDSLLPLEARTVETWVCRGRWYVRQGSLRSFGHY